MTREFKILDGLPAYGPEAMSFPRGQLGSREGLVIRFERANPPHWVGNFSRGTFDFDKILNHPDGKQLVVCAGGNVYFVDPENPSVTKLKDEGIVYAAEIPRFNAILLGDSNRFTAIDANGIRWTTEQISWDGGFRKIAFSGDALTGEAYSALDDKWHLFEVDLQTGACKGGIYKIQIADFIPIVKKGE